MSTSAVERAAAFFQENGRDIDRARFRYHFDGGTPDELLTVLARYQNEDGGFGRGLEPDIGSPASNPFATELALLIARQAEFPLDHPLLQRAVAYLEREQGEDGGWRFSEEVQGGEMAPWFAGWEWPNLNPAGSIAGHLRALGLGSPALHEGVVRLFAQLADPAHMEQDDYYAARPYALYFLPEGDHPEREAYLDALVAWLLRQHEGETLPDASHFFDYAPAPDSYSGARLPAEVVEAQLARLAAEQEEDGGWPSPYAAHWRGWLTVQSLLALQAYGRL